MTSVMSAASAAGSRHSDIGAGAVAIAAGMGVTAVVVSVMCMVPCLNTSIYGADRIAGIGCCYRCYRLTAMMMSMSRDRGDKED